MTGTPKLLKTLRNPASSGVVSCVVPFPDCRHIARFAVASALRTASLTVIISVRRSTTFGCGTLRKHRATIRLWPSLVDPRHSRLYLATMEVISPKCVRYIRSFIPQTLRINSQPIFPVIDPGARFMVTASSNRGLHGESTRTVFVHDIKLAY